LLNEVYLERQVRRWLLEGMMGTYENDTAP
jgi:hypothetical protein